MLGYHILQEGQCELDRGDGNSERTTKRERAEMEKEEVTSGDNEKHT